MILSGRLQAIKDMIEPCDVLVDVGCDHGYLTIAALQQGLCRRAVASDIRKAPLERARKNAEAAFGKDKCNISFILSDGLTDIPVSDEKIVAVIAGMGGMTIRDILMADSEKAASFHEMILSPQSEIPALRRYLGENGYHISNERYISDQDKLYVIMKVRQGEDACRRAADYHFGPCIEENLKDPAVRKHLEGEYERLLGITGLSGVPAERLAAVKEEIKLYKEVLYNET